MPRISEAERHGLKVGTRVIVLTIDRRKGLDDHNGIQRRLYLYETGASYAQTGLNADKVPFKVTYEPWDGVEQVSFYNGD
jgi:hypothetical protein